MEEFKLYWANRPKSRDDIIMISNRMHEYAKTIDTLQKKITDY